MKPVTLDPEGLVCRLGLWVQGFRGLGFEGFGVEGLAF